MARGKLSEHEIQKTVLGYARQLDILRELFAVPNAAHLLSLLPKQQRFVYLNYLKAEGMRPGVFDLVLPVPALRRPLEDGEACGLFMELKTVNGSLSDDQREWGRTASGHGYETVVCASIESAVEHLNNYRQRVLDARKHWR